jgi:hypothetical protein
MFKQYLRFEDGKPFGVVVLEGDHFGWSICCAKDKFDKRKGIMAAIGRALTGRDWIDELSNKPVFTNKKTTVKTKGGRVYPAKIFAVIDKMKYLKEKLKV